MLVERSQVTQAWHAPRGRGSPAPATLPSRALAALCCADERPSGVSSLTAPEPCHRIIALRGYGLRCGSPEPGPPCCTEFGANLEVDEFGRGHAQRQRRRHGDAVRLGWRAERVDTSRAGARRAQAGSVRGRRDRERARDGCAAGTRPIGQRVGSQYM